MALSCSKRTRFSSSMVVNRGCHKSSLINKIYLSFFIDFCVRLDSGGTCSPLCLCDVLALPAKKQPGITAELQTELVKTAFPLSNFIALILRNTLAKAEESPPRPFQFSLPSSCSASTNTPKSCLFTLKIISPGPVY